MNTIVVLAILAVTQLRDAQLSGSDNQAPSYIEVQHVGVQDAMVRKLFITHASLIFGHLEECLRNDFGTVYMVSLNELRRIAGFLKNEGASRIVGACGGDGLPPGGTMEFSGRRAAGAIASFCYRLQGVAAADLLGRLAVFLHQESVSKELVGHVKELACRVGSDEERRTGTGACVGVD